MILEAIESKRPPLAVCGHIHEAWDTEDEVGEPTKVINPGPSGPADRDLILAPKLAPRDDWDDPPRSRDEWRVPRDQPPRPRRARRHPLRARCTICRLDDEARKLRGGLKRSSARRSAYVFIYAWHEESAREAERASSSTSLEDEGPRSGRYG